MLGQHQEFCLPLPISGCAYYLEVFCSSMWVEKFRKTRKSCNCRKSLCRHTVLLTYELRIIEWQIMWSTNACLHEYLYIMRVSARLHVLHAHDCVNEQLQSVCPSASLFYTLRPLPCPIYACKCYLATQSSPQLCCWIVSSVAVHNGGWILWPTTPTWHIHKSLTVTLDNRWRVNQ